MLLPIQFSIEVAVEAGMEFDLSKLSEEDKAKLLALCEAVAREQKEGKASGPVHPGKYLPPVTKYYQVTKMVHCTFCNHVHPHVFKVKEDERITYVTEKGWGKQRRVTKDCIVDTWTRSCKFCKAYIYGLPLEELREVTEHLLNLYVSSVRDREEIFRTKEGMPLTYRKPSKPQEVIPEAGDKWEDE